MLEVAEWLHFVEYSRYTGVSYTAIQQLLCVVCLLYDAVERYVTWSIYLKQR